MLPRVMEQEKTHFGYSEVPKSEKAARVRGVFDSVASRYDLMNDLMSGGLHRWWKNAAVAQLPKRTGLKLLDLAGGTGDIAFRALERVPEMQITVADINASMLAEGQKRAIDRNFTQGLTWLCADAEKLPLPTGNFDACTMAFGIRNVTDIPAALREIYRVLKPGGMFLCLEFSPMTAQHPAMNAIYDAYSFQLIPRVGQMVTGDAASYQYLVESIRKFPEADKFADMLRQAGFDRVNYERFTFGVVALHKGWKI